MIFPAVIIAAGFAIPEELVVTFALLLPIHILVGVIITSLFKRLNNLAVLGLCIVYVLGAMLIWQLTSINGSAVAIIFIAVLTAVFFLLGVRIGIGSLMQTEFHYFIGLAIYGVSLFVISRAPALKAFFGITVGAAILYVLAGLPLANRRFLLQESRMKSSLKIIPGSVVRGNRIIVAGVIILIVLLSFWDAVLNAFVNAVKTLVMVLIKIMDWFSSLFVSEEGSPDGQPGQMELPPADGDSNSILNIILNIIAIAVVLLIFYLLIRYLVKNHKRIYAAIQAFFSNLFGKFKNWGYTEQGYTDRQESLLKTEVKGGPSFFKRVFARRPKWRDMKDNSSRIRFIYARFVSDNIKKGLNFRYSDTPDETVEHIHAMEKDIDVSHDSIRTEYNKVRYGEKEPTDETVNELKKVYLS